MNENAARQTETADVGAIEIRLRELGQLFNTFEPTPFHEGSLRPEAEEYLLQRVGDLPRHQPVCIVIHLPAAETARRPPNDIARTLSSHFASRATAESKKIRELFRNGRRAALIGFATLSVCLFLAWHVTNTLPSRPIMRVLQESFIILGWVSMWKPIEMFLYDWLPPNRRQRMLSRLAAAEIVVQS